MIKQSTSLRIATAAALSFGIVLAGQSVFAKDASGANQPAQETTVPNYGPSMMGPGMMYGGTPAQRRPYWGQTDNRGYGPGMMGYMTPEQRQQNLEQMRAMMGYGG